MPDQPVFPAPENPLGTGFLTQAGNRTPGVTQPQGKHGTGILTQPACMAETIGIEDTLMKAKTPRKKPDHRLQ